MEGNWNPNRLVILEFDSVEQAKAWYYSDEYAGPALFGNAPQLGHPIQSAAFVEGV